MPLLGRGTKGVYRSRGGAAVPWYSAGGLIDLSDTVLAYQSIGAESLAASYSNLVNPGTYDAAPGNAPAWDSANGWKFNGSDDYLTTGYAPTAGMSIMILFTNLGTAGGYFYGARVVGNIYGGRADNPNRVFYIGGSNAIGDTTSPLTAGTYGVSNLTLYKDGIGVGNAAAGGAMPAQNIALGGYNRDGTVQAFSPVYIQAVAIYSASLTAPQMLALSDGMAALP